MNVHPPLPVNGLWREVNAPIEPMKLRIFLRAVCYAALALGLSSARAQLLSVDINGTAGSQNTAPGFVAWNLGGQTGAGIKSVTQNFTNFTYTFDPVTGLPTATNVSLIIPCTVAMTTPGSASSTVYLNAKNANKNGYSSSTDPNAGWRLSIDGAMAYWKDGTLNTDQPYTNGGAISLTISNLPAGVHSFTTYHNDPWGLTGATWHTNAANISRCIVSANGVPVFTNTPTGVSTNDSKCGFAYFYVTNSYDGQPVVLNFDPDHSSSLDFTILNGFEIDRPAAPGMTASAVYPAQGDEHAFANNDVPAPGTASAGWLNLQWQPAGFALSNFLYFGASSNAVLNATVSSNEFQGGSAAVAGTTNSFLVTNLSSALTYYWRVDQLDVANGVTNLVKGYVWKFRTRHLAFPGAEGYGRWARGGRGGVVLEVTNLNDSGPGSYRAAIAASGPRTIIFRVSGLIQLQSQCIVGNGYVTIAGQTAPGDGICIANWRAGMSGPNDVIMRFMRFRVGDLAQQSMDAMSPGSATHTIIDHCSSSWSLDVACNSLQSGAVGSQSAMTTYQRNIISEPLQHSYHYNDSLRASTGCTNCYQAHAFAASISGEIGSYHHNLIAHSTDRNWSLAGGLDQSAHYAGSLDIRNNVIYNWTARTTDGGCERCNYVSNYYKPYPANPYVTWLLKLDTINTNWGTEYYYMSGNTMEGKSYDANNWMSGSFYNGLPLTGLVTNGTEIFPSYVTTQTARDAFKLVLSDVGANQPQADLIDRRIVQETLHGTTHYEGTNGPTYTILGTPQTGSPNYPGIIDSQTDVHDYSPTPGATNYSANYPWPPYNTYSVWTDSDHDGLPDWWESLRGTNPHSAPGDFSDANADLAGDGYTELERYLNWLAAPHALGAVNTALNFDLGGYAAGFTNPVYAVTQPTNGTVALLADGHTAHFAPAAGFTGAASFQFTAGDGATTLTNAVTVLVLPSGPQITTITRAGDGTVSLAGSGTPGTAYILQGTTNLATPGWQNLATNTATGGIFTFTDSAAGLPLRFYRTQSTN
jgi:Bacterial Ig domain